MTQDIECMYTEIDLNNQGKEKKKHIKRKLFALIRYYRGKSRCFEHDIRLRHGLQMELEIFLMQSRQGEVEVFDITHCLLQRREKKGKRKREK